jgi:hypothetical protein
MENLIAGCGIDCAKCEARTATLNNDNDLRLKIAEQWRVQYNVPGILPEMINCTGCREAGAKIGHWDECEIRKCATSRNYQTCAECDIMESCELAGNIFKFDPATLENLKSLRL